LPFGALIVARRYNDLYLLSFAKALRDKGGIREWKPPAIFGSPRT
jgi:Asp-tRNA(Asn)/Glu-tRNA(Gln) amidotransferase A subunit family amidase